MRLRNEKLVLSHLKEFGSIGQTEAMWYYRIFPKELEKIYKSLFMKDIGNGLILSKITEPILGFEYEYHIIDTNDIYKHWGHGNIKARVKKVKSENF